jgi:hypothetical protein
MPAPHGGTDGLARLGTDSREKTDKVIARMAFGSPGPKGKPQEVKTLLRESTRPICILTIDDLGLLRMEFQMARYHIELRTDLYLRDQVFEVLAKHGVGQVLSHWTWLPPLRKQLAKANGRFFNAGNECVIRLLTPLNMRYEDAYAKAYPFDMLVDGMLQPEMVSETVDIIKGAIEKGLLANFIINNRAGGNAPLIAQLIAEKLFPKTPPKKKGQLSLW